MRKLLGFFAALIMALSVSGIAFAAAESAVKPRFQGVVVDYYGALSAAQERDLERLTQETAEKVGCTVGIVFSDTLLRYDEEGFLDYIIKNYYKGIDDIIFLLLYNNPEDFAHGDRILVESKGEELFGDKIEDILLNVYSGQGSGGYYSAARAFCASLSGEPLEATYSAALLDYDNVLTEEEEQSLFTYMTNTANSIECNVGVVITDNIEGKADYTYARETMERCFGRGTDSIVMLYNNDRSNMNYADYIYTNSRATDVFEPQLDAIFDALYKRLDSDGFYASIDDFCSFLITHNTTYVYEYDENYSSDVEMEDLLKVLIGSAVVASIVTFFVCIGYKSKKPVSAMTYMRQNGIVFTHRSDVFLREFTTSRKISTSSGSRSRSGSSRRRSGGGHHRSGGGGGRGRRR